jgi:small-conductance mechanosensitive channel
MTEKQIMEKLASFKQAIINKNKLLSQREDIITELEEKITNLGVHVEQTNSAVENKQKENSDLLLRVSELGVQINNLKEELAIAQKNIADKEQEIEKLRKELSTAKSIINDLENKKVKHDETPDVDVMMKKIKTSDVKTSTIDETINAIKNKQLFRYSFGVANKEFSDTLELFIKCLYKKAPLIGRYYILNKPETIKQDMSNIQDNTFETIKKIVYNAGIIEERNNNGVIEYVSLVSESEALAKFLKAVNI